MTAVYRSTWTARDADPGSWRSGATHGLNRRPPRAATWDLAELAPLFAAWTAANRKAAAAYRARLVWVAERDRRERFTDWAAREASP